MKTKDIRQSVLIRAPVRAVYRALMDSKQHTKITGSRAVIGRRVGSAFSVWGGAIHGTTLFLQPNARIVQAWRSEDWPKGCWSIAVFQFRKAGTATRLTFEQYGVPADHARDITDGWREYYWEPMKMLLVK